MPRGRRANIGRRTRHARHARQQQVYSQNLGEERQNIIRENARLRQRVRARRSLASYRHKCFTPLPKEATVLDEAPVTVDNDLEEDVKDCAQFFSVFTPDKPQISKASSHQPSNCINDTNAVKNQNTPKRTWDHTKQLDSLCEVIKIDLQDVSDEIFFQAKWKILDVLLEVHQKKVKITVDLK